MVVPRELGGLNMDAAAAIEVWEEISRADASAGWSLRANALATGMAAAFLGDDAILRMFGGSEKPVMGGMAGPGGSAVPENGGYRGSGKYQFGRGCMPSDWFFAGLFVSENCGLRQLAHGGPDVPVCYLPRQEERK